jgi:hypothetical protein
VHVVFPKATDTSDILSAFGRFGEIASVEHLPNTRCSAVVVFFDIRAAAAAARAFEHSCFVAPQCGYRSVQAPGTFEVDEELWPLISDVRFDGRFFDIDFFDIRDAAQFSSKIEAAFTLPATPETMPSTPEIAAGLVQALGGPQVPPGLELPAAFSLPSTPDVVPSTPTMALGQPPGLELPCADSSHAVRISGLPNELLSDVMFEVVLDQACVSDALVSFTTRKGKRTGEAVVRVKSSSAASHCVRHFQGCHWDARGAVVKAEVVSDAERPVVMLSKEAPVFVPTGQSASRRASRLVKSETSTDVGDSSDDAEGSMNATIPRAHWNATRRSRVQTH